MLMSLLLRKWFSKPQRCSSQPATARRCRPQLEPLEERRLMTAKHFDFDTTTSPTASGYTHVPLVAYSHSRGYGWQSTSGLFAADRGTGDALTRDMHLGASGTFLVDLPNGTYDVTATIGDARYRRDCIALWAQGTEVASGLTSNVNEFLEPTFRVTITNGQLAFKIADMGGTDPYFALCGLDIKTAPSSSPLTALYVSTQGNDANNGETVATAFRTIKAALAHATYGMTIYIEPGTYHEQIVTRCDGTANQPIVITNDGGTVTIDGSTLGWTSGGNQNQGLVELRRPYSQVVGLTLVNSLNTGVILGASHVVVANCNISQTQRHGISVDTQYQTQSPGTGSMLTDLTVQNNVLHDNVLKGLGYGQALSIVGDGFLVSGNEVYNSTVEGIDIWLGAKHGEVVGNLVHNNARTGIFVDGASYVRLDGNKTYGNPSGIGVSSENVNYSTHDIWVYNNVAYNNSSTGLYLWDSSSTPGYHGSQNVLFTNNTLINNPTAIYLSGDSNTATIMNNLAYATMYNIRDVSTNSTYSIHNNVYLSGIVGFVSPSTHNYDLTSSSQAIDRGSAIPPLQDDLGNTYYVTIDYLGRNRVVNGVPDAGAYEFQ